MERVEGVELGEALPEGLIGQLILKVLDEVYYLSCVSTTQSNNAVVKLGENASKISDSKLSFHLSNPTCALSAQNSGSLRATACASSLFEAEAKAGATFFC